MNKVERARMVKAMETIARSINDEDIFDNWLMFGVADGDIKDDTPVEEIMEMDYYLDDESFGDLMGLFLRLMKQTEKSGGLYCDKVVSTSI